MNRAPAVRLTALTAVAAVALAACGGGGSTSSSTAGKDGGDLVIARTADSQSMNNTTIFDNESIWVFEQIIETAVHGHAGRQERRAVAGDRLHVSADKLTYTFTAAPGREVLHRPAR